jgi:hypothetical protein
MAGSAAPGPVTVPTSTRPVRFVRATPDDDAAIRRLLRDNPMAGSISLSFEREPGYFAGAGVASAVDDTILVYEAERLLCMGRSTTREATVDGAVRRVAYLGELRLDAAAANRVALLRGGYRFFRELPAAPADFTFTSIAADNHRALRLLERSLPGFPTYTFLADYVTLVLPVPRRALPTSVHTTPATDDHVPELVGLLNAHAARHTLAPHWTPERLTSLSRHGLPLEHFHLSFAGPQLIAGAAIWDQRSFRQTVIRGYEPALATARPFLNLSARLFGTPHLPPIGSTLAHACLSPLALAAGHDALLPDFVAASLNTARTRRLEFLTLGLVATDPRIPVLEKRFRPRLYRSRLYRVTWPDAEAKPASLPSSPLWPEVALL